MSDRERERGRVVSSNKDTLNPQDPHGHKEAKQARRAANQAHQQATQTRAFWLRRVVPVTLAATAALATRAAIAVRNNIDRQAANDYDAALQRRSLTPNPNPEGKQELIREAEANFIGKNEAYYGRYFVLVNLVEGLTIRLNAPNMDRLLRDPRVRIRINDSINQGITPVRLLFVAPLQGADNPQELAAQVILVDPLKGSVKEAHEDRFKLGRVEYRISAIPFYATERAVLRTSNPSAGDLQKLGQKLSEDLIRASIQSTTLASNNPIFGLNPSEERVVEEFQPVQIAELDSRAIRPVFNTR